LLFGLLFGWLSFLGIDAFDFIGPCQAAGGAPGQGSVRLLMLMLMLRFLVA
jgi:hypothetical protein